MLSQQILLNLRGSARAAVSSRNIGLMAPCLQKATDPIQQLFVDKLRAYTQKSGGGNKLVEASPDIERELKAELDKVEKVYGGGSGVDMTKFPSLKFTDPTIDPINLEK